MRGPIQSKQKPWDKVLLAVVMMLCIAMFVVAGLDAVRYRTSNMPLWLEVLGAAGIALGIYIFHIVMRTNSYATAVVRIQDERGHQVISTGPYAFVRHPMYSGAILYFLGIALLLGSWYAVAIAVVLVALFGLRAVWEEQTLIDELPGYAIYAQRVRYRLIPSIW
jgi:protein-S-isoprenylcysteine O-methyltransferase Ste14